jgi:restriction system protein
VIPDYQTVMLPLLQLLGDGQERPIGGIIEAMADHFQLSQEERRALLPSGQAEVIRSRVGWARTYLNKAGLIEAPRRGIWRITDRGRQVLTEKPEQIDSRYLERFPEFVAFRQLRHDRSDGAQAAASSPLSEGQTPEEALESAYQRLRTALEEEVLDSVKAASPSFFERLVVEVLVAMGYGGSLRDAGQAIGRSGDGGIDGIIKEDQLGLDAIYIQAKRWDGSVGRPEIQKFAGALQGHRARKGVFLTTGNFTADAKEFAGRLDSKIVLIAGPELAYLMVENNVGVSPVRRFELRRSIRTTSPRISRLSWALASGAKSANLPSSRPQLSTQVPRSGGHWALEAAEDDRVGKLPREGRTSWKWWRGWERT